MRKFLGIAIFLLLVLCISAGIAESMPFHSGRPAVLHISIAVLFIIAVSIHIWLNRKAFIRYFKGANKG